MAVPEGGGAGLCRGRADLCRWRACVRLAVLVPERLRGWFSLSEAEGWLFRHDAGLCSGDGTVGLSRSA